MGEAAVTSIVGSRAWYENKKKRAKFLVRQVDEGYVELGLILHRLHETPKNNDPKQLSVYETWGGYKNFGDFVEESLGLNRRKAERIRNIGQMMEVHLAAIPPATKKRLISLGWTKLNELCRVFQHWQDHKTVLAWAEMAEKSTYPELMRSVQLTMDKVGTSYETDGDPLAKEPEEEEEAEEEDEEEQKPSKKKKVTVEQAAAALPQPSHTKMFSFLCYDEQVDNVYEALERAKQLSAKLGGHPDTSKSALLSLVCLDFLATNDWGQQEDPKLLKKYLKRLELGLGIKLIGVIGKDQIVYGESTVQKLFKQLSED